MILPAMMLILPVSGQIGLRFFQAAGMEACDVPEKIFDDACLLKKASLKKPAVMMLFEKLKARGLFDEKVRCPKSLQIWAK